MGILGGVDVRICGQTVNEVMTIKPKRLPSMGYHIFLKMVLHARKPSARAELCYKALRQSDFVKLCGKSSSTTQNYLPMHAFARSYVCHNNRTHDEFYPFSVFSLNLRYDCITSISYVRTSDGPTLQLYVKCCQRSNF